MVAQRIEYDAPPPLVAVRPDRRLRFNFHKGQWRAWNANERIIAVVAGTQGGKTTFGPIWLWREMQRCGPGTYLVAAPTDPLLQVKLIPAFKDLFVEKLGLGIFLETPRPKFVLTREGARRLWNRESDEETVVYFGYAAKPDSLESMTAKAAWLDEAGQAQFKVGSWEAVLRRLSLSEGRILITTTPYTVGHWLRRRVFDKTHRLTDGTRRNEASVPWTESIRVVQFKSIWNPAFPRSEWNRAKKDLPRWKFRMMYCGEFERPAGQIYDVFNNGHVHTIPRFALPERWPRYLGLDFGGVNTYGTYVAEDSESRALYVYRTYHAGNRTAAQHVEHIAKGEPRLPIAFGGAKSEQQWRDEFKAAGLGVAEPLTSDVEIGIDRVYAQLAGDSLQIFDDLEDYIDEWENYARKTDEEGKVYDEIANKNEFHGMDSTRYIIGSIRSGKPTSGYTPSIPESVEDELRSARLRARY